MIIKKIVGLMERMERDSEEELQDNQHKIKDFVDKFDKDSEFIKYFKNELKNAVVQLKLEKQFKDILDFESEPVPEPIPPAQEPILPV